MNYWFPKVFGFKLDEKRGKISFYCWVVGFYLAFMPLYPLGLMGGMRRNYHFENISFKPYLLIAEIGAIIIFVGFLFQLWQIIHSFKNRDKLKDVTGDPWDGRTLEWALPSPAPFYNWAFIPEVTQIDHFWYQKHGTHKKATPKRKYEDIHMPKSTPFGFIISVFAAGFGFAMIWHMWIPAILSIMAVIAAMIAKSFFLETDYYVKAAEVEKIENAHMEAQKA